MNFLLFGQGNKLFSVFFGFFSFCLLIVLFIFFELLDKFVVLFE